MSYKKPTMRKCDHGIPKFMCDICKPSPERSEQTNHTTTKLTSKKTALKPCQALRKWLALTQMWRGAATLAERQRAATIIANAAEQELKAL
jgi:hypothetical protein